jgi:Ca2+-binding EF-hand superfamily protein
MNNPKLIKNNSNNNNEEMNITSNSNTILVACPNDKKQLDEFRQAFQTYDKENKGFVKINEFKHLTKSFFNKLTDTDLDLLVGFFFFLLN